MPTAETYNLLFKTSAQGADSLIQLKTLMGEMEAAGAKAAKALDQIEVGGIALTKVLPYAAAGLGLVATAALGIATAGVAAGKALFELSAQTGRLAEQQQNTADRLGLTIKEVGLFSTLAENAGVNAGAFTTSMRTLSKALSDNSHEGQIAKKALSEYNVTLTNAYGAALPMRETYVRLGEAIGGIENPAKRADFALKVLGRGGLEILPALKNNARDTLEELERLGVGFDEAGALKANNFYNALHKLNNTLGVTKRNLGELGAGAFLPFVKKLSDLSNELNKFSKHPIDYLLNPKNYSAAGEPKVFPFSPLLPDPRR